MGSVQMWPFQYLALVNVRAQVCRFGTIRQIMLLTYLLLSGCSLTRVFAFCAEARCNPRMRSGPRRPSVQMWPVQYLALANVRAYGRGCGSPPGNDSANHALPRRLSEMDPPALVCCMHT